MGLSSYDSIQEMNNTLVLNVTAQKKDSMLSEKEFPMQYSRGLDIFQSNFLGVLSKSAQVKITKLMKSLRGN